MLYLKESKKLNMRFAFFYISIVVLFGILNLNLINLQLVEGNENLFLSSTLKTSEVIIRAPRGLIFDRNGDLVVKNHPSYRLVIDLNQLPREREDQVLSILSEILEEDKEGFKAEFTVKAYEGENRVPLSQVTVENDVPRDRIISIYSRIEELPGVFIEVGTRREYVYGDELAHILGYVREVSAKEVESDEFSVGDSIGASGIEQSYDADLRGLNGKRISETDRDETVVRDFIPISATSGNDLMLTLDSGMQMKMTEALQAGIEKNNANGGSAIILDIETGEILTMVSLPSYNSNDMSEGISLDEYLSLEQDPSQPFFNRSISLNQPPGSTFKTIVASSALEKGTITRDTVINSTGCMDLGGGFEFCEVAEKSLGKLDLILGIARSSNIYFCETMIRTGMDNLNEFTDDFGLGQKTGIDIYGEQPGIVASQEMKEKVQGEPWYLGDTCNTSIGQGLTKVSPIQMVSWVSTIANGGTYYKPHLVTLITDNEGLEVKKFEPEEVHKLPISPNNLAIVREGMHQVVNDPWGSAYPLRNLKSDPAAKTGSAETFRKVNESFEAAAHSWVTGFFPYDDPQYAFVVYLEYGGWGFHSAEVMKEFFDWYDVERLD